MHVVAEVGGGTDAGTWVGLGAGLTVILGFIALLFRRWRGVLHGLRNFLEDWSGVPDRIDPAVHDADGQPRVLVPGRRGVLQRLADLETTAQSTNERTEQLERRGNGHLADVVHRIDEKLDDHREVVERRIGEVESELAATRRVAGLAATVAARADDVQAGIREALDDLREQVWARFTAADDRAIRAEIRDRVHEAALRELGIDVASWDDSAANGLTDGDPLGEQR